MLSSMRLLFLMLLSAVSCSAPAGPGMFAGKVGGNSLTLKDTLFVAGKEIWLTDTDKLCEKLAKNTLPKGGTFVKFTPHPIAAGDLTVDPSTGTPQNGTVFAQFFKLDDTCNSTVPFGDADHATGWFSATYCDAPTSYPSPECAL